MENIYFLVPSFTIRSAPLLYIPKQWAIENEEDFLQFLVRFKDSIPLSYSHSAWLKSVTSHTDTKQKKNEQERKYKYNEIRIMPFAIDLKFIYEPLTSDSFRPTFKADETDDKKSSCLPCRANAYVCNG